MEGYRFDEIAAKLDVRTATVRSLRRRLARLTDEPAGTERVLLAAAGSA